MPHLIRAHSIFGFDQVCKNLNIDGKSLLKAAGLEEEITPDSASLVSVDKLIDMVFSASVQANCPHIGILIAQQQDIRFSGPLGSIMSCAADMKEAWTTGQRYLGSYSQGFSSRAIVDGANSMLINVWDIPHIDKLRPAIDLALAHNFMISNHISHGKWKPKAVCFSYSVPDNISLYRQFFKSELIFDADFDGFIFDEADLNIPLPGANSQVFKALTHYGSLLMEEAPAINLIPSVKSMLKQMMVLGEACSIGLLAQRANINVRTLQRRFKSQETNYQTLLQEVRDELACFQLQHSEQSLTQVALLLGYQDLSSFSYAFKQSNGISPREYRRLNSQ